MWEEPELPAEARLSYQPLVVTVKVGLSALSEAQTNFLFRTQPKVQIFEQNN
jgi:hypothetical protein